MGAGRSGPVRRNRTVCGRAAASGYDAARVPASEPHLQIEYRTYPQPTRARRTTFGRARML